jgi:hypothetical protein
MSDVRAGTRGRRTAKSRRRRGAPVARPEHSGPTPRAIKWIWSTATTSPRCRAAGARGSRIPAGIAQMFHLTDYLMRQIEHEAGRPISRIRFRRAV